MSLEKPKARGAQAVNNILSIYAEQPATLAELLACMKTSAKLRSVWKAVRAEMGTPTHKRKATAQTEQAQQHERPPSPRPAAWGNAVMNEGGGAKWGDGAAPAKVEEPAAQSESSGQTFGGSGSTWG